MPTKNVSFRVSVFSDTVVDRAVVRARVDRSCLLYTVGSSQCAYLGE